MVAEQLRGAGVEQTFTVLTIEDRARQTQRSLTALSLGGLSRSETSQAPSSRLSGTSADDSQVPRLQR